MRWKAKNQIAIEYFEIDRIVERAKFDLLIGLIIYLFPVWIIVSTLKENGS